MRARPHWKVAVLVLGLLGLAACKKQDSLETKPAVEAGIRAYLAQRPGLAMDKMEMELKQVEFKGETAEADVLFRVKSGEGEMPFHYTLRRQGDHWVVERSGAGPTGTGPLPPGHPPVTTPQSPPEKLPRSSRP